MKARFFYIIVLFFMLKTQVVAAGPILGADITYKCLSPGTYEIILNVYQDCTYPALPTSMAINYFSQTGCGGFANAVLQPLSTTEISPICTSALSTCSAVGGSAMGVEHYQYIVSSYTIGCPGPGSFSWSYCCRHSSIYTISSSPAQDFYVETNLDVASSVCNNSPEFLNEPLFIACEGVNTVFNNGAYDSDGDSLVYSLVDCQQGGGPIPSFVDYVSSFSGVNPLLSSSIISIDPQTGSIEFTPSGFGNQQTVIICVQVEEYRAGSKIGSVVRDIQLETMNCSNQVPDISGVNGAQNNYKITTCPGASMCFDVFALDVDQIDVISLTYDNAISGATFTQVTGSSGANSIDGQFCWTPSTTDIGEHYFTLTVKDDHCPLVGKAVYTYTVEVLDGSGITGCMDSLSLTYNPNATCMDSSLCTYGVPGCTDTLACNFDSTATVDDGSCGYNSNPVVDLTQGTWNMVRYSNDCSNLIQTYNDVFTSNPALLASGSGWQVSPLSSMSLCGSVLTIIYPGGYPTYVYTYSNGIFTLDSSLSNTIYQCIEIYQDLTGCTDSLACNYDSTANVDDGSCSFQTASSIDLISGSPNDWYTDSNNDGIYESCSQGYSYFVNFSGNGTGMFQGVYPITSWSLCNDIFTMNYYSGLYTGSVIAGNVVGITPSGGAFLIGTPVFGCTDPNASNYDSLATCDDGSCIIVSCTDNQLTITVGGGTYDSEISWDLTDGLGNIVASGIAGTYTECLPDDCYTFNMYDSWGDGWNGGTYSIIDNVSTTVYGTGGLAAGYAGADQVSIGAPCSVPGCTDTLACNYDSTATVDDGSCILSPSYLTTDTACDSYTWSVNGQTYTTSGTYTDISTNTAGCDTLVTLNLTINNSTSSSSTETACDSFTWSVNGQTYTTSGTYTDVSTNAAGCAHTDTLNLTINNSIAVTDVITACDSYTWIDGNTYTSSNNTATHILTNATATGTPQINIGDNIGGGIVFYVPPTPVDLNGDGTLDYGLVCTINDLGTTSWGCTWTTVPGADGTAVGTGMQNTNDILAASCSAAGIAADICANHAGGGYNDWYLPSKDELNLMHANLADPDGNGICCGYNGAPTPDPNNLGGFDGTASYWSSSESTNSEAYYQHFGNGFATDMSKGMTFPKVRAIRAVSAVSAGCDTVVTLNLTINNSTSSSSTETACDSYTWSINGQTYTTSGTYTEVSTNAAGCAHTD
ncbi:MAG: DUF1566 domain-containing protein, partial [Saprospiraceae bacterium]|nr:DUF1566 domain-containing protein [Saprospiraceae bacterium]